MIPYHGNKAVDRRVDTASALPKATSPLTITLDAIAFADLQMLADGGYAPLDGFMGAADIASSLKRMQLSDGTLWPIPIVLPVDDTTARSLEAGQTYSLVDASKPQAPCGTIEVSEVLSNIA